MPREDDPGPLLEIFRICLDVLGIVATSTLVWIFKQIGNYRAMVRDNNNAVRKHEETLGILLAAHTATEGGRVPLRKIDELTTAVESLAEDIERWQRWLERLESRDESMQQDISEMKESQARSAEAIQWIKDHINSKNR